MQICEYRRCALVFGSVLLLEGSSEISMVTRGECQNRPDRGDPKPRVWGAPIPSLEGPTRSPTPRRCTHREGWATIRTVRSCSPAGCFLDPPMSRYFT